AGVSQRGNLLSRVFSQAVRSRLLFLLPLVLSVQVAWSSALGPSKPNSPQSAAPSFNSTRAMQYVREVVAFGPRAIGSGNHKKQAKTGLRPTVSTARGTWLRSGRTTAPSRR